MNGSGEMTLAFELSALKALASPGTVFDDARRWTQYVGVISDQPTYVVTNFTRKNRIRQDFFSGPKGKAASLDSVRSQFDTDRHVFVGVTDDDRELAEDHDWEFLHVEDAAEAAEWALTSDDDGDDGAVEEDVRDDWP
ncbi:DUF7124 domain-containing protein [Haladaptatus pallidirubidus]|uniref:DUF7124 domain-containing protein n=1 Tax=Haladaptatus pallidirubidus TaxID=1008152 RepID=A0AAV3UG52_9EURY|nr:hypothetical protein [Haladaptatus pallidirubidus]